MKGFEARGNQKLLELLSSFDYQFSSTVHLKLLLSEYNDHLVLIMCLDFIIDNLSFWVLQIIFRSEYMMDR